MPSIQIRNVKNEIYKQLKTSAELHHRSITNEALSILENALEAEAYSHPHFKTPFDEVDFMVKEMGAKYGTAPSSVSLIREDRDR